MVKVLEYSITQPLMSIVVPVHNMSNKLDSLKSWVKESPPSVELILLHDDHNFDDLTYIELRELADNSKNVKIFREHWGNPGDARNFGKNIAQGIWIMFADSDDFLYVNEVVGYLEEVNESDVEVIIGQFELVNNKDIRIKPTKKIEDLTCTLGNWRIVYNRVFVKSITFPSLRMGEDQVFFCKALALSPRIRISKSKFYSYHTAFPGQLTSKRLFEDVAKAIMIIQEIVPSTQSNRRLVKGILLNQLLSLFVNEPSMKNGRKLLETIVKEYRDFPYPVIVLARLMIDMARRRILL